MFIRLPHGIRKKMKDVNKQKGAKSLIETDSLKETLTEIAKMSVRER
jgi:hypothetical protein